MKDHPRLGRALRDLLVAVGGVGVTTLVFWLVRGFFGEGDLAQFYLPVVALVAALGGVRSGLLAAVLAFLAGKYFFVPAYFSLLRIHDPKDWVSLAVSVVIGLAMGIQSQRVRHRDEDRQRLQNLAARADALQESDRLKNVLISSVSHELRTPLASATATVTGLLEDDLEWDAPMLRQELAEVRDDLRRLDESIGSLLDLSRLESGAWAPQCEWCDLGEVVGTTLKRFPRPKRARIVAKLPPNLPAIFVDYAQWIRVLQNLLENALAYSPPDRPVHLSAEVLGSELHIAVEDRGPGVAPDERERIFEKFYRGTTASMRPAGTGLGLAVARDIVRFHGGRLWVQDREGGGACFVVALLGVKVSDAAMGVRSEMPTIEPRVSAPSREVVG